MSIEKSFCILPFMHLATHPDGRVTPCCESKLYARDNSEDMYLGGHSVDEIRNNNEFKKLRKDMLSGKLNSSCNFCYKKEEAGLESKRIRENKNYNLDYSNVDYLTKLPLHAVELRLGNVCNAKCVICHPGSSSKWNEDITDEIKAIDGNYEKTVITNTWFRDDNFYDDLILKSNQIKHIWFNGGEPLLIKEHFKFLRKLTELGITKNITLEYHSNGTLINEKVIELWKNFKHVKITLSLDDILDRFYYARFPLTFDKVENGIKLLKRNNIHYDIIPTINLLNVYNSTNIYEYFVDNYNKECMFNYLRFPKFQSIVNLPEKIKEKTLKQSRLPKKLHNELEYELYSEKSIGLNKAVNFYRTLDKQRGVKLEEYLPEWKFYLQNKKLL
jgi:sulfatase maturation enzyme AslB (radical SAM superfamily)